MNRLTFDERNEDDAVDLDIGDFENNEGAPPFYKRGGLSGSLDLSINVNVRIAHSAFHSAGFTTADLTAVSQVGVSAFAYSSIVLAKFGNRLEKIDEGAFAHCRQLTRLYIGNDNSDLTPHIMNNAFAYATALQSVYIHTFDGSYLTSCFPSIGGQPNPEFECQFPFNQATGLVTFIVEFYEGPELGPKEDNGVGFLSGTPLENIIGEYASDTDFYAYYILQKTRQKRRKRDHLMGARGLLVMGQLTPQTSCTIGT